MARSLRIDRDTREDWAVLLTQEINEAKDARRGYLEQVAESYNQYRNILPAKSRPWPGCSNLQPPVTTGGVEKIVQRTVMQFLQGREYVHMRGLSDATSDRARKVEAYHRWQAEAELDYARNIDLFQRSRTIAGTGVMLVDWARTKRTVCDVLTLGREIIVPEKRTKRGGDDPALKYVQNGEPQKKGSAIDEILFELFGSVGVEVKGKDKMGVDGDLEFWDVLVEDRGQEYEARVTIDKSDELGDDIEVMAEIPRLVKDQPVIEVLNIENVIVAPGPHTIQDAPLVVVRDHVNVDFIEAQLDSDEWYLEGDERDELMAKLYDASGEVQKSLSERDDEDVQLDDDDSFLNLDSTAARAKKVVRYRILTPWDIRQKDELVDAEIVMLPKYQLIVRAHYDSVNNRSGMRNLVSSNFLPVRDQFYGLSLPQFVKSVQQEINTIHNQHVDRNSIAGNPFGFIDPSVHMDRDNLVTPPGTWIPIPNPQQSVMIPQFQSAGGEDFALEQQLQSYAQDMLAVGPLQAGRSEGVPNAQRTWRGAQLLVGETSRALEYQAEMMRPAVVTVWKIIYAWNAANIREGKEFRILGTDEVQKWESREEFRGDYDFIFDIDRAVLNPEMERFLWTEYLQMYGPLMNAPPGTVQQGVLTYAIEDGKRRAIPNPQRFFQEGMNLDRMPLTPDQEHQILAMGHPVEMHPQDNVMEHAEKHLAMAVEQMNPDSRVPKFPPAGLRFFMAHVERTLKQMEQIGGLPQGFDMGQAKVYQGQPGGAPGPQPPAVAGPEMPNQGPGVEVMGGGGVPVG